MPQRHWTLLSRRYVSDHRIFRVREDLYRVEPHGVERDFVVLEGPDWVNIVPITDDGRLVLVRQYRHGAEAVTLEIPGGLIDHGEAPVLYAPMSHDESIQINGNSDSHWTGTFLAPASPIIITGTGATDGMHSQVVGYTVELGGTSDASILYNDNENYDWTVPPQVQLSQ